MIDPQLVIDGIHHCATKGKTCGGCPIILHCDWGEFDTELMKTIDSMLSSQQENKKHFLEEVKAEFNEALDQFMRDNPQCIAKPVIEVRLEK